MVVRVSVIAATLEKNTKETFNWQKDQKVDRFMKRSDGTNSLKVLSWWGSGFVDHLVGQRMPTWGCSRLGGVSIGGGLISLFFHVSAIGTTLLGVVNLKVLDAKSWNAKLLARQRPGSKAKKNTKIGRRVRSNCCVVSLATASLKCLFLLVNSLKQQLQLFRLGRGGSAHIHTQMWISNEWISGQ